MGKVADFMGNHVNKGREIDLAQLHGQTGEQTPYYRSNGL